MVVRDSGSEVLTKHEKEWKDVCYNLKDQGGDGSDDDEGGGGDDDEEAERGRGGMDNGAMLPGAVTTRRMRDKGKM